MSKFIVGQCVGLPKFKGTYTNKQIYDSVHILSSKDIERGYYWCNNGIGSFALSMCVHREPNLYYINRCQTLKGKVTQPCNEGVFLSKKFESLNQGIEVSCYINFKGKSLRAEGCYWKGQVYFMGTNEVMYKTKVYVTEDGYLCGISKDSLGEKQKRQSTRFAVGGLCEH